MCIDDGKSWMLLHFSKTQTVEEQCSSRSEESLVNTSSKCLKCATVGRYAMLCYAMLGYANQTTN